ncbi:MAG: serine hydrolase domain-containing protein, partial [Flavobacteriales bacterium]
MLKPILPRRIQRWLIPFISVLGVHANHAGNAQDPLRISKQQWSRIDASVEQAVEDFNLPSLSVAVVHQGKLVHIKSAGILETGLSATANEKSKYAVASNTKAFTSAALAKLVDQELISWKDPVTKFLPEFKLYDPYVTSELTIEDLLCHRSGLATFSGDLLWYGTTWSSEEVLERAQYLEPVSSFRTDFGYQNILYIAAGSVIEKVSGIPWKSFIQDSLLVPMGMDDCVLSTNDLPGLKNVAQPHNELEDQSLIPIDWVNWDNMAPAGALIASVSDMSKWMIVQMDSGRTNFEQLWNPQQT